MGTKEKKNIYIKKKWEYSNLENTGRNYMKMREIDSDVYVLVREVAHAYRV